MLHREMVTTRQLADKIVEIYWPHTLPFAVHSAATVLKQNATGQAEIVSAIRQFRERQAPDPSVPRLESRRAAPRDYERLVRRVEWKLIEMPLPRLQTMGRSQRPFIYDIYWDDRIVQREVAPYLAGEPSTFDNRVMLKSGVGEYLLQLSGLLRPLIQRRWAAMVAQLNHLEESQLELFLFGADRTPTARVRAGLWRIQDRRCFYCDARVSDPSHAHVDHFLPWSRYPDDGLDNFVVADRELQRVEEQLAGGEPNIWRAGRAGFRVTRRSSLSWRTLRRDSGWDRGGLKTVSVARAIYLRLPQDARLVASWEGLRRARLGCHSRCAQRRPYPAPEPRACESTELTGLQPKPELKENIGRPEG